MTRKKILKICLEPVKKYLFLIVQNTKIGKTQKKIHVVRSDTIGDFVLFSAILPYFKKLYPGYKVVLIGDAVWAELALWLREHGVLGGESNYFDELIPVNGKSYSRNLFYYYKILKKLRLSAPEIVLQPTFSRTEKSDGWVLISKEAFKIGYDGSADNIKKWKKERNDKRYDRLIDNPGLSLESDRNRHFLNEVAGREIVSSSLPKWRLSESLLSEGRDFLSKFGIDLTKPISAIFPGASSAIRCWPVENFTSLLLKLHRYDNTLQFVLIGGPRDEKICLRMEKEKQLENLSIYNLCGKTKLSELAEVLAVSRIYIGNETGAAHMTSAVGTSAVIILGGGHYGRFFPYLAWKQGSCNVSVINKMECFKCGWKCIYEVKKGEPAPCVKNIEVEKVYDGAIKLLLNKNNKQDIKSN